MSAFRGCVVVLGMHRSGTSMVAELLHRCGVTLGPEDDLLAAHATNRRGFWEPRRLIELNNRILAAWEANMYHPRASKRPHDLPGELREDVRAYAETFKRMAPMVGWKDPRLALTWRFWSAHMRPAHFVWVVRNPLDVARSLQEREGIPLAAGIALWLTYTREIRALYAAAPGLLLHYERLLAEPEKETARLTEFLQQRAGMDAPAFGHLREALDADLQHHATDSREFAACAFASPAAKRMYAALREDRIPEEEGAGSVDEEVLTEAVAQLAHWEHEYRHTANMLRRVQDEAARWRENYLRLARTFPVRQILWLRRRLKGIPEPDGE